MDFKDFFFDEVIQRLLLALLFGGVLGFERQIHGRAAGLRTHILVCFSSTMLMLSITYLEQMLDNKSVAYLLDPSRLAAGIMTGIGFIGAGTILRSKNYVLGLTTSACVWLTASLGIVIGLGFYELAFKFTVASLFVLWCLGKIDLHIRSESFHILTVIVNGSKGIYSEIDGICNDVKGRIIDINISKNKTDSTITYNIHIKFTKPISAEKLIDRALDLPNVIQAKWESC